MRQLILDLIPDHPPTLENFVAGGNADALTALAGWLSPESREPSLLLWGEAGAGKTHLLRACCALTTPANYADAADDPALQHLPPLNSVESFFAIDNVEALNNAGQIALFNLFNRLRADGGRLLTSASAPPLQLSLREDLRTRLGSGLIYRLRPLSDAEKIAALGKQASLRGMRLSDEALNYILNRAPRDMRSLSAFLAALDLYSLEHKRPLTLPLLRELLQAQQSSLESAS
ncbi:MAG: DnaA regulatory inactivator Hda [Zoogloeaceae bacterium]|nr:DnaA regulatory inactivator Hda [Zoogloeaceae bacterium]